MSYVNTLVPKDDLKPIEKDGNYIFFSKNKLIIAIDIFDKDKKTVLEHQLIDKEGVFSLKANTFIKPNFDIYMLYIGSDEGVKPSPSPVIKK